MLHIIVGLTAPGASTSCDEVSTEDVPLLFAFTGRPPFVIIIYTVVGSLFIPFLAATLLYMNTRIPWTAEVPRNHWTTNVLLVIVLAVFLAVGLQEIDGILR